MAFRASEECRSRLECPFMPFRVAVLKETRADERRRAMVPAVGPQLEKLGAEIVYDAGPGEAADPRSGAGAEAGRGAGVVPLCRAVAGAGDHAEGTRRDRPRNGTGSA